MHKTKKKSFNMCSGTSGKRSYTQVILRIRQFGVDNSVLLRLFPHVQKRETDRYVEQLQSRCRRKERKRELGGQTQENTADVSFLSTVFFFFYEREALKQPHVYSVPWKDPRESVYVQRWKRSRL